MIYPILGDFWVILLVQKSLLDRAVYHQIPDIDVFFLNLTVRRSHLVNDSLAEVRRRFSLVITVIGKGWLFSIADCEEENRFEEKAESHFCRRARPGHGRTDQGMVLTSDQADTLRRARLVDNVSSNLT